MVGAFLSVVDGKKGDLVSRTGENYEMVNHACGVFVSRFSPKECAQGGVLFSRIVSRRQNKPSCGDPSLTLPALLCSRLMRSARMVLDPCRSWSIYRASFRISALILFKYKVQQYYGGFSAEQPSCRHYIVFRSNSMCCYATTIIVVFLRYLLQ